jgi:outer membrane lipoprotein-sorting protein
MQPKTKALTAAVVGTALGIGGLAVIAMPASAGDAPSLPAISAENLVQSVMTAKAPALDGTVTVDNNLGLPSLNMIPGAGALDFTSAQVFSDGTGKSKLSLDQGSSQETIVNDGTTVWTYKSEGNTANKLTLPVGAKAPAGKSETFDPATAATQLLGKMRESSTVSVQGTAQVAGRSAYELVLTPKPSERTLLREIRVSVDSETRLPLRLAVLTNGTSDPALQVSFSEVHFAAQPASEFQFTPPKGAKVTTDSAAQQPKLDPAAESKLMQAGKDLKIVGNGWDTVVVGKVPADLLSGKQAGTQAKGGKQFDPMALLDQFTKPVSGSWGTGHLITTKVGTAILTDDGRFAAGAVPEQVLSDALAAK